MSKCILVILKGRIYDTTFLWSSKYSVSALRVKHMRKRQVQVESKTDSPSLPLSTTASTSMPTGTSKKSNKWSLTPVETCNMKRFDKSILTGFNINSCIISFFRRHSVSVVDCVFDQFTYSSSACFSLCPWVREPDPPVKAKYAHKHTHTHIRGANVLQFGLLNDNKAHQMTSSSPGGKKHRIEQHLSRQWPCQSKW